MPLNRLAFLQMLVFPALQPPPEEPTGEMRYRTATDLLSRGRRFERAAELLRRAQKQLPEDPRIPAALGCALVSRVASLMYASTFSYGLEADHRNYPKAVAAWKKGKENPESEYYEQPRPEPPPQVTFPTKDDSQPFRLRPEELAKKTTAMVAEARLAFETARKIAKTPEAKAEVAYLEGWSLRILQTHAGYDSQVGAESGILYSETVLGESEESDEFEEPAKKEEAKLYFPKPDDEEIRKAFTLATEKDPENALYWQSLGDVLNDPKHIESAYLKSLERNPRNPSLWHRLYKTELKKDAGVSVSGEDAPGQKTPHRERALFYLYKAAQYDPANGWYACEEAYLLFKETKYSSFLLSHNAKSKALSKEPLISDGQKQMRAEHEKNRQKGATSKSKDAGNHAVLLVERGNRSPNWEFPRYREPVPRLLAVARSYMGWATGEFSPFAQVRELARSLAGYGLYLAQEDRDNTQAVRSCRAAIGLGQRLEGNWPLRDDSISTSLVVRTLVGNAVVTIGMNSLIEVEKVSGSPQRAAQFQTEYAAYRAKVKAYIAARSKVGAEESPYTLY